MKNNILLLLLLCSFCVRAQMEDVLFTIENAELTSENGNDYYEADVFISSTTEFKYGFGQLYITYNTVAFGNTPNTDGRFEYTRPEGSLLDQGIDATEFAKFYSGFNQSDNTPGIISINWQHAFAASTIANDNVIATPKLLLHFRIQYIDATQDPMICFDIDLSDDQNTEACGPFSSANPFETADCTGVNLPVVVPNDSYTCDNAGLPITCATTSTYTTLGGWDNGIPDATTEAIFQDSYDTSLGNITACQIVIQNGATLTINAGEYALVDNTITVDMGGAILVAHQGSVVQVDNAAEVTNNGSISVGLTTPNLNPRDFMVIGSPMTAEVREDLAGFRMLRHDTSAFDPYTDQPVPGVNFLDNDNNDWSLHTGLLNPGEGYYYIPGPDLQTGGSYNLAFNTGTLNNGVISYATTFGTDQADSPNIISNPYASAIDAESFRSANTAVNELYFWEHTSTPSTTFPGANSANYSMEDISVFNAMGSDGVAPTIISTAQGFGYFAATADAVTFNNSMRLTTGNTTLRTPNVGINRLWLNVSSDNFDSIDSNMMIGFTNQASAGYDTAYDSKNLASIISLYSRIEGDHQGYIIQGREAFSTDMQIPVGFSSQIKDNTAYTISLSNLEGIAIENTSIYLIDNHMETITNLSLVDYSFTSEEGNYPTRFTIVFENEVLNTADISEVHIALYPNPASDILHIASPNNTITSISIMDIRGRMVLQQDSNTSDVKINIETLESAVYFVNIQTEKGTSIQRCIKE